MSTYGDYLTPDEWDEINAEEPEYCPDCDEVLEECSCVEDLFPDEKLNECYWGGEWE